jgi:hypothetical protein
MLMPLALRYQRRWFNDEDGGATMSEISVVGLRMFLPATEFEKSFAFYEEMGFSGKRFSEGLALMEWGQFGFLLQQYDSREYAKHLMMQLLVKGLDAWWERIRVLDLGRKYGVNDPSAPAMQPWGLRVSYVFDPTGLLWHVAEDPS